LIAAKGFYGNSFSFEAEVVARHVGVFVVEVVVTNCTPFVLAQHFESAGGMPGLAGRSCNSFAGIFVY
jgi:hydroxylamine reductase (hybrid-cluster protein)